MYFWLVCDHCVLCVASLRSQCYDLLNSIRCISLLVYYNAPFAVVSKFEQIYKITGPNNEYVRHYPGSQLWIRCYRVLNLVTLDYLTVQVVDGNGNQIEPAWSKFSENAPMIQYAGLIPNRLMIDRLQC